MSSEESQSEKVAVDGDEGVGGRVATGVSPPSDAPHRVRPRQLVRLAVLEFCSVRPIPGHN